MWATVSDTTAVNWVTRQAPLESFWESWDMKGCDMLRVCCN